MRCEADLTRGSRSYRCPQLATDNHHMLFRSRGGGHLDKVGETYHRIDLCHRCHMLVHDQADTDLIIEGYVTWDRLNERPVYQGPDEYLMEKYGEAHEEDLPS